MWCFGWDFVGEEADEDEYDDEDEDEDEGEIEDEGEVEVELVGDDSRDERLFFRASCWECRRRYFCRVKARSGDLWVGSAAREGIVDICLGVVWVFRQEKSLRKSMQVLTTRASKARGAGCVLSTSPYDNEAFVGRTSVFAEPSRLRMRVIRR